MTRMRDITGFMAQAMAADPVGCRAIELAADIEFALAGQSLAPTGATAPNATNGGSYERRNHRVPVLRRLDTYSR